MKKRLIALLLALCIIIGTGIIAAPAVAEGIKVYVIQNVLPVYNNVSGQLVTLGTMSFGEEMTCIAVNSSWACVKNAAGAVGYCKTEGLSNVNPNRYSVRVYAKANGVRVYAKADANSRVLAALPLNASYIGVAMTPDSAWIRLQNGPYFGYVPASQMSPEPVSTHGALVSETVYVSSNTLPVYASANTASRLLGTMSYGESMRMLAVNGAWARVMNHAGAVGYCMRDSLISEDPNILNLTVHTAYDGARIYQKPHTSSAVLRVARANENYTAVTITLDGEWLRLKNGSAYGYIMADDVLTFSDDDVEDGTVYVMKNLLNVYAEKSESSRVLGTMAYGESMKLLEVDGEWATVLNDLNETGYCLAEGLTYQNLNIINVEVYIAQDGVSIHKKPDTAAEVMQTANRNDAFTAVAITEDGLWMRVELGLGYGYVQSEYISDLQLGDGSMTVYVSDNTLPVYQSPDATSRLMGTMAYGESMVLHEQNGIWAKVGNDKGETGYCSATGLTIENPNTLNESGFISQNGVQLYRKPSTAHGTIKALGKDEEVTVVAVTLDEQWKRVISGDVYGYVQAEYINDTLPDTSEPSTIYVSVNTLTVYAQASDTSRALGSMSYGEEMTLINVTDGWAEVRNSSGETGYCSYGGLTQTNPNGAGYTMYAQSDIALYKKPLTDSAVLSSAAKNAALTVVAVTPDNQWARVALGNGSYAYAQTAQLAETKVPSGDAFAGDGFTNVVVYGVSTATVCYASPSTSAAVLGHLYLGQNALCTGRNGDWARVVNASGTVAYCKVGDISTDNPNKYNVPVYAKFAGAKVYEKPVTSSRVLASVGVNARFAGVAVSPDGLWYRLQNGSAFGYVQASDFSTSPVSVAPPSVNTPPVDNRIKNTLSIALAQSGKKYVYGAEGPNTFDCSGLIVYALKHGAGITNVPRTAEQMGYSNLPKISNMADLREGDLVFFNTSTDNDLCDHVGFYLGGGNFVHASSAAGKVVTSSLASGYYNRTFSWGRRVF